MTIFAKITRTDRLRKGSFHQVCPPFKARGAHYIQSPLDKSGGVVSALYGASTATLGRIAT